MSLIKCKACNRDILSRIGTVCPNCGHVVGYFEGNEKRKKYGKFFALSIIAPFFSFILVIIASSSKIILSLATFIYISLAYISFPIRFKKLFFTKFEKFFFMGIWILTNSFLVNIIYNLANNIE